MHHVVLVVIYYIPVLRSGVCTAIPSLCPLYGSVPYRACSLCITLCILLLLTPSWCSTPYSILEDPNFWILHFWISGFPDFWISPFLGFRVWGNISNSVFAVRGCGVACCWLLSTLRTTLHYPGPYTVLPCSTVPCTVGVLRTTTP